MNVKHGVPNGKALGVKVVRERLVGSPTKGKAREVSSRAKGNARGVELVAALLPNVPQVTQAEPDTRMRHRMHICVRAQCKSAGTVVTQYGLFRTSYDMKDG